MNPLFQQLPLSPYFSLSQDEFKWSMAPKKNDNTWDTKLIRWGTVPNEKTSGEIILQKENDGILKLKPIARANLLILAKRLGYPLRIVKAYTTPEYEKSLTQNQKGVYFESRHSEGMAFDIAIPNYLAEEFISTARAQGFGGIGGYRKDGVIHIDLKNPPYHWGDYGYYAEKYTSGFSKKAQNYHDRNFQRSAYIMPIED